MQEKNQENTITSCEQKPIEKILIKRISKVQASKHVPRKPKHCLLLYKDY